MEHLIMSYITRDGYREWEYRTDALKIAPTLNVAAVEVFEFEENPVAAEYGKGNRTDWTPPLVRRINWEIPHKRVLLIDKRDFLSPAETAAKAQTSVQAVRDVLRDDARRAAIFPGAYRTSDHPQRGEWRIPRAEVEAWQPRRVNQN